MAIHPGDERGTERNRPRGHWGVEKAGLAPGFARLLVDPAARTLELGKDLVEVLRLDHEFLEPFH